MYEEYIYKWLNRNYSTKSHNELSNAGVYLYSDMGLSREVNEDAVATMQFSPSEKENYFIAALADGMGGMQNGKECAINTIATFFGSFIEGHNYAPEKRISFALNRANEMLYKKMKGKGGSTISAIIVNNSNTYIASVGDSRIYGVSTEDKKVSRLTIDDSFEERIGSENNGLLQFIGIEGTIDPQIKSISNQYQKMFITTDGVHFINETVFNKILSTQDRISAIPNRLLALSRWLGSPDNASIVAIDIKSLYSYLKVNREDTIHLWGCKNEYEIIKTDHCITPLKYQHENISKLKDSSEDITAENDKSSLEQVPKPKQQKLKKPNSKKKGKKNNKENNQLYLEIVPEEDL
jgi:serine/threonine protein phosphatase PrpC